MPNFEAKGKHCETGKIQRRSYQVPTEIAAVHCALKDGMIIESIRIIPDDAPTDKQLAYANDLGIDVSPGMTKNETRDAIAARVDNDEPSTEKDRTIAQKYGIEYTKYVGRKGLFDRIFYLLESPGKEKDLIAWFTYCVYLSLMHGEDDGQIDNPQHPIIQKIASDLSNFDNVIMSIKRYKGHNLISFGEKTSLNGTTSTGGSDQTIAYKMVSGALRQRIDFPAVAKLAPVIPISNIAMQTGQEDSNTFYTFAAFSTAIILLVFAILGFTNYIIIIALCGAALYFLNKKYPHDILSFSSLRWGVLNAELICPHCRNKGFIRTKSVQRKKGISGGKATAALFTLGVSLLATGLSRKEELTQARCTKCNFTWDF